VTLGYVYPLLNTFWTMLILPILGALIYVAARPPNADIGA
jgi:hypothetical protein